MSARRKLAIVHQQRPPLVHAAEPEIAWQDYDRIEPGVYFGYCKWAKRYQYPRFRRWTCLLRFDVLSDDLLQVLARVPWWMSLGKREKPHAGRGSRYFREWVRANGRPPTRGDRLSPKVFTRRMARVEIADTKSEAPYSVVRRIISWEAALQFRVNQSASHTVNGGMG